MQTNDPLSEYIAYLRLKALSEGTIESYRYTLEALFRFLGLEPAQVSALDAARIRAYVAHLKMERGGWKGENGGWKGERGRGKMEEGERKGEDGRGRTEGGQ